MDIKFVYFTDFYHVQIIFLYHIFKYFFLHIKKWLIRKLIIAKDVK